MVVIPNPVAVFANGGEGPASSRVPHTRFVSVGLLRERTVARCYRAWPFRVPHARLLSVGLFPSRESQSAGSISIKISPRP